MSKNILALQNYFKWCLMTEQFDMAETVLEELKCHIKRYEQTLLFYKMLEEEV